MKTLTKHPLIKIISLVFLFSFPVITMAAPLTVIPCIPQYQNCNISSINQLLLFVINWLLSISGSLAILFVIIGGFRLMTAGGNEESAARGKKIILDAIIGIIIIIMSYAIISAVANVVAGFQ